MNIEFIGNGNMTSSRYNASYLINHHILFDAPAGVSKRLASNGHELSQIDVIVISHLHGDHYFDLPFILFDMYSSNRKDSIIIIGPKELKKRVKQLCKLAFPNSVSKIFNSLDIVFVDAISVNKTALSDTYCTAVSVKHGKLKNCFGYIFEIDNKKIGFTGDTEMCPGLSYIIKEVNYCVIDVNKNGNGHHLILDNFEKICKEFDITFLPTHYPDEIKDELDKITNVKMINCDEHFYI